MSWDGIIFCAPANVSINDLPSDFQMPSLGTTAEIGERLRSLFPEESHFEGQCCVKGDGFWLEFSFGYPKDVVHRDFIGVRTNAGLGVIPVLAQVCGAFNARLFDNQTSEFADLSSETESSMSEFAAWRDRNLKSENDQTRSNERP